MTLGRNTIMRLSRQYAASESAKKAVARGSWFVARKSAPSFRMGCGQISQRAAQGSFIGELTAKGGLRG